MSVKLGRNRFATGALCGSATRPGHLLAAARHRSGEWLVGDPGKSPFGRLERRRSVDGKAGARSLLGTAGPFQKGLKPIIGRVTAGAGRVWEARPTDTHYMPFTGRVWDLPVRCHPLGKVTRFKRPPFRQSYCHLLQN
jgi:hypothetical protein